MADCQDPFKHVRAFFRVRLMDHAHVAFAGSPGLVGVYSGDNDQTILCLLLYFYQAAGIVTYGLLIIGRAGAYDHQKFIALSRKDFTDLLIPLALELGQLGIQGKLFPYLSGGRQLVDKCKSHNCSSLYGALLKDSLNISGVYMIQHRSTVIFS